MFKNTLFVLTIIGVSCHSISSAADDQTGEGLRVAFGLGVSVPSENFADVYGLVGLSEEQLWKSYDASASLGIHATGRLRFGLSRSLSIVASATYHRFASVEQSATLEDGRRLKLGTVSSVIPIAVGVQYFVIRSFVSPYLSADLTYTASRVIIDEPSPDFTSLISQRGVELEPAVSRFGASLAAGIEFTTGLVDPFLEVRYSLANVIGREVREPQRAFVQITVGIAL